MRWNIFTSTAAWPESRWYSPVTGIGVGYTFHWLHNCWSRCHSRTLTTSYTCLLPSFLLHSPWYYTTLLRYRVKSNIYLSFPVLACPACCYSTLSNCLSVFRTLFVEPGNCWGLQSTNWKCYSFHSFWDFWTEWTKASLWGELFYI